jgi:hypothetical protein
MYPTNAAVLHILPSEGRPANGHEIAVRAAVDAWIGAQIGEDASDRRDTSRHHEIRTVALGGPEGHGGEIREVGAPDAGDWAWEGWIERPLLPDETCAVPRTLRTDIQMRVDRSGDTPAVVMTLREQLAFPRGGRAPNRQAEMAPPSSLLDVLLGQFRVVQGSIEWTRSYWTVKTTRQVEQLYERIVDPQRAVSLVVCVGDDRQEPPVDPAELGRALFGIARVVHIAQPRLTRRLRELIGEKHRVGWNVIRLYRPGYSPGDSGGMHRFFRKAEIDAFVGDVFPAWLSRYIRREESHLIAPDRTVRERFRAAERRQASVARGAVEGALAELKELLGDVALDSLADAVGLLTAELAAAQDRLAEAEALATAYADELDRAAAEAFGLRARIAGLEEQVRGAAQGGLPANVMAAPTTVREAIEQVLSTVSDGEFIVQDHVLKQVERQRLALNPEQVRDTLLAIRDVARAWRAGHGDGRSPADYFRERGVTFKADVSDTARQQYAADYTIEIDRDGETERVLMGPHVDLSIRHRIYWYHDKEGQRFVVGHIGDHLRDASTR